MGKAKVKAKAKAKAKAEAEVKKMVRCDSCKGDCCTGIVLDIPKPRSLEDFENIRWYLYHEKTHVYIDWDGDWVVEMDLPCTHRDKRTGRCRIYDSRPPACREASSAECERNRDDARVRFRTVADYDRWLDGRRPAGRR